MSVHEKIKALETCELEKLFEELKREARSAEALAQLCGTLETRRYSDAVISATMEAGRELNRREEIEAALAELAGEVLARDYQIEERNQ